eukprot:15358730-Heterocapsa_arctica.AAC.1
MATMVAVHAWPPPCPACALLRIGAPGKNPSELLLHATTSNKPLTTKQNHRIVQHSTVQHSTVQYSTAQHSTAQH